MRLSTKGRYAVLAMMELALHDEKGLLTLADLSLSQNISLSYLEQLFARLRISGLVAGVRGPRGGYRLARPVNEISIADILQAVDDKTKSLNTTSTTSGPASNRLSVVTALWNDFSDHLRDYLSKITLEDTIKHHATHNNPAVVDIHDFSSSLLANKTAA